MLVILDIETTGLDPNQHEIIEVGCLKFDNNYVLRDSYSDIIYVRNFKLEDIHGISQKEMESEGRPLELVISKLNEFLSDVHTIIGHNIDFDLRFLRKHLDLSKFKIICTLLASRKYLNLPKNSLEFLCRNFNFTIPTHRALADCHSTFEVFKFLNKKYGITYE